MQHPHPPPSHRHSTRSHTRAHTVPSAPTGDYDDQTSNALDKIQRTILLEQRVLAGVTAFTALGFVLWIVSVCTDYWFIVYSLVPEGVPVYKNVTYFLRSHSGLWRICTTSMNVSSTEGQVVFTHCHYHQLFPTGNQISNNPQIDDTIIHYSRTETAFAIISLILMVMGHGFSLYTFFERRYMFKRLAGGIHFLTAATTLVVLEILINSVAYEEAYLPARHPKGASWHYGFSFFFAWISFMSFVAAGCSFLFCSRKHKGDKAASEIHALADEPHILGRV